MVCARKLLPSLILSHTQSLCLYSPSSPSLKAMRPNGVSRSSSISFCSPSSPSSTAAGSNSVIHSGNVSIYSPSSPSQFRSLSLLSLSIFAPRYPALGRLDDVSHSSRSHHCLIPHPQPNPISSLSLLSLDLSPDLSLYSHSPSSAPITSLSLLSLTIRMSIELKVIGLDDSRVANGVDNDRTVSSTPAQSPTSHPTPSRQTCFGSLKMLILASMVGASV